MWQKRYEVVWFLPFHGKDDFFTLAGGCPSARWLAEPKPKDRGEAQGPAKTQNAMVGVPTNHLQHCWRKSRAQATAPAGLVP